MPEVKIGGVEVRFGAFTRGNCWRWRYQRRTYHDGEITWHFFWRFFVVVDRRFVVREGE